MKILLLSRYDALGASSRVRSYQYIPYLEDHGIQVTTSHLLDNAYLEKLYAGHTNQIGTMISSFYNRLGELLKIYNYDLLWIEKELFPWVPALAEKLISFSKVPFMTDYDDAFFHKYDLHSNLVIRQLLGKKIQRIMKYSKLVTVGNQYLADHALKAGAQTVKIIPTVVDLVRYPSQSKTVSKSFTIGWIGTPITSKYLRSIKGALSALCSASSVRITCVGAESSCLGEVSVDAKRWSEETEVSEISSFDVGIMPLLDGPWEKGKCGYKLIQYMACGIPVVASPVGVNKKIVIHGKNGFLARSEKEWIEAITLLRMNPDLRVELGRNARKTVEQKYSLQVVAPLFLDAIEQSVL